MASSTWLNRAYQAIYLLWQTPRFALAVLVSKARGDGDADLALKWLLAMNAATPEMILKLRKDEDEEEEKVSHKLYFTGLGC